MDSTPRGAFEFESDLVQTFEASARTFVGRRPFFLTKDLPIGSRIADVVLCVFAKTPRPTKQVLALARLSGLEIRVLAELLERPLKSRTLQKRLAVDARTLERAMRHLQDSRLVKRVGGTFSATSWTRYLPERTYFFEAKLSRWRNAVVQATYYRQFADDAFVALPSRVGIRKEIIRACRGARIGLVLVGPEGTVDVCIRLARRRRTARWGAVALRLMRYFVEARFAGV